MDWSREVIQQENHLNELSIVESWNRTVCPAAPVVADYWVQECCQHDGTHHFSSKWDAVPTVEKCDRFGETLSQRVRRQHTTGWLQVRGRHAR